MFKLTPTRDTYYLPGGVHLTDPFRAGELSRNPGVPPYIGAILEGWSAPSVEVSGSPKHFGTSRLGGRTWRYKLIVDEKSTVAAVRRAREISNYLAAGAQGVYRFHPDLNINLENAPGGIIEPYYPVTTTLLPEWKRDKTIWFDGKLCRLTGKVEFSSASPYGRYLNEHTINAPTSGAGTLHRSYGNVPSYPTIYIRGTLSAAQTVRVRLNGRPAEFRGPLAPSQRIEANFDLEVIPFDRLVGQYRRLVMAEAGVANSWQVDLPSGGTISQISILPNSRCI